MSRCVQPCLLTFGDHSIHRNLTFLSFQLSLGPRKFRKTLLYCRNPDLIPDLTRQGISHFLHNWKLPFSDDQRNFTQEASVVLYAYSNAINVRIFKVLAQEPSTVSWSSCLIIHTPSAVLPSAKLFSPSASGTTRLPPLPGKIPSMGSKKHKSNGHIFSALHDSVLLPAQQISHFCHQNQIKRHSA